MIPLLAGGAGEASMQLQPHDVKTARSFLTQ